jgi:preprotein translocase SecE subunit
MIASFNLKSLIRKIKFELLQIKYPSFKEVGLSSALVFLMLIIASGLVVFFDFSIVKIIKFFFSL